MRGQNNNPDNIWRFIKIPKDPDGCWIWQGKLLQKSGYGRIRFNMRNIMAHRFVYEYVTGKEIPKGLQIDHLCRNRACVNPDHLEPITAKENINRGMLNNQNKNKTHCIRGHTYTNKNTRIDPKGARQCRECDRFRNKRSYHKNKILVKVKIN